MTEQLKGGAPPAFVAVYGTKSYTRDVIVTHAAQATILLDGAR